VFFQGAYPGTSDSQRLLARLGTRPEPMVLSWRADDTAELLALCPALVASSIVLRSGGVRAKSERDRASTASFAH
jgi:hypothetical protein